MNLSSVKRPPWGLGVKNNMNEELNKSMYYGAVPATFQKARQLRNKMTSVEKLLWERLKSKQICNVRFRRQHPISKYIADFYCHAACLVVELDGKIHLKSKEHDKQRTENLKELNIKVMRFSNNEVEKNIDEVLKQITTVVKNRLNSINPSLPLSPKG
ncbi:Very-short-patch-repair endonuclease [Tangfeifania diversioriginum]|uniref:Very-short-patch-repair endonuclease n=1 Tax=Tangfeifania diversioriginum TaxID=1168035 RepID=A0A1M6JBB4_9BACT|nr:endonuclease domain-containing protein [Tangfeifania diversioriginum]SHJ44008.1 Very-short-patch-repair endonuclease [Tangfeifania diversioriginum]